MSNISNSKSDTVVSWTNTANSVTNSGKNVTINGGAENDTIRNYVGGTNALITGGAGNDSINNTAEDVTIFGGDGNNTIRSSGENAMLIGGDTGNNVIIAASGNSTLLGSTAKNTLTGGSGANIFIHRDGAQDLINNYDQVEDIIILSSGKVAESLTSTNGNDTILKIADGDNDLGTITVKGGASQILTIYDADMLNECKETFREFTTVYVKAAIKTFEEDEDIQSILTDGADSAVLADIKAVNSELAAQIAQALKLAYDSGNAYLETVTESNGSADLLPAADLLLSGSADVIDNSFSDMINAVDYEATVLTELANVGKVGVVGEVAGKAMSKLTGPLSVALAVGTCVTYDAMLYSENTAAWIEAGSPGDNWWQRQAMIREQNAEIYDGAAKAHIDLATTVGGLVVTGIMGAFGIVGAPVILTASAFIAAGFVGKWAYDKFIAKKLDAEADKLQAAMSENFAEAVGGDISDFTKSLSGSSRIIDLWDDNIVSTYEYFPKEGYSTPRYNYKLQGNILCGTSNDDAIGIFTTLHSISYIDSGAGDDAISNNGSENVSINSGAGDDSIDNWGYNVLIQYTEGDGNDFIQGFNETSTLSIASSFYSRQVSGDDVIVKVGDGKITLAGAAGLDTLNIKGTTIKTLTLNNNNSAKITLPTSYTSANASKRTTSIIIAGNSLNNSIVGGAKADTLDGGKGNDTLTGGWGADTFVYTGGKDVITDYGANFDKISLAGAGAQWLSHITGVKTSGSDVTLTFSNDSNKTLTLNGAAGKKVIINGVTRTFTSSSADVYWFDENDFGEAQLDSIIESTTDYSLGKLDTTENLTKLTKDEFTLTFGKK